MTGKAIGETRVIEVGRLPGVGRVTTAALTRIVIGRSIRRMASDAIREAHMHKGRGHPCGGTVTRAA